MKFPICNSCVESTKLCNRCKNELEKGIITKADIKISRIIYKICKKMKALDDVNIERIVETKGFALILCNKDYTEKLRNNELLVKQLSKEIGKSVIVATKTNNIKHILERVIEPSILIALNIIYTPEEEKLKARIFKETSLPFSESDIKTAIKTLFGKDLEFVKE